MAEKNPVAIRIARPWDSEEELLANELETLTRTSVVLVGAQQRPEGVVLRFEVTLRSGTPVLRGEGRVVGYKPNALGAEPGLALRFTRLDSKSKAFVDRAAALRDGKARPSLAPPPPAPTREDVSSDPVADTSSPRLAATSEPDSEETARTSSEEVDAALSQEVESGYTREPTHAAEPTLPTREPEPAHTHTHTHTHTPDQANVPGAKQGLVKVAPSERAEILERLRARARDLSSERISSILKRA